MKKDDDCVISHASLTFSHVNFIALQLGLVVGAVEVRALEPEKRDLATTLVVLFIVNALLTGVYTYYLCIQTWIDSLTRRRIFGHVAYIGLLILNSMTMASTVVAGFALI